MKIRLAYGKSGLEIDLPDHLKADVIASRYVKPVSDPHDAVRAALQNPIGGRALSRQVRPQDRVAIVINDITRPTPYEVILPALLEELSHVPSENIILFNATGTHRSNTEAELRTMLGNTLVDQYPIVQNCAEDPSLYQTVGSTKSGNEIHILRQYLECEFRILTGFIEPHFFAGFSGGPKACVPGLANLDTILRNHSVQHIDSPDAAWGKTAGNPLWEDLSEAADLAGQAFLLNVALNRDKQITAVFAGNLHQAHQIGCDYVRDHAMAGVTALYDVVITCNSGYPLDLNLYQSIKGLSAAARIVRPGGIILAAADCWDGIPEHGLFKNLLVESKTPDRLLETLRRPGFSARDSWQAQIHAQICRKARVCFYSDHLSDQQIRSAFMQPCRDIAAWITREARQAGGPLSICVLPEGPLTIPYLLR